jgi:RNA polymerase sigma-70 factor (ECF subfamily)
MHHLNLFPPGRRRQQVTQVFKQFRDPVYRYLVAILKNPSTAEEITQETFLRLYGCLRDGQDIANVRSWVFRVARNLALNENAGSRFLKFEEPITLDRLRDAHESVLPDLEQSFLRRERIHIAMRELSRQQRECLALRAEGFRYREIAQILVISPSTVAQSLKRGITKLAKELP